MREGVRERREVGREGSRERDKKGESFYFSVCLFVFNIYSSVEWMIFLNQFSNYEHVLFSLSLTTVFI